jgi:hypothetical protein
LFAMALACSVSACASRRAAAVNDFGIPSCPSAAERDLLSTDALQCWFIAPHGRWRVLSHDSHYTELLIQVEAADTHDAELIAQRFVAAERDSFSEILLYVQRESDRSRIRRVRWTAEAGFQTLDFTARR